MHCSKCVSFWGTSYSRPPTHTSLSPCYKILAAPLASAAGDWQLRDERRPGASAHGDVGDVVGATAHVQRPAQRQALVEASPAQRQRHPSQPGRARRTGAHRLRGTSSAICPLKLFCPPPPCLLDSGTGAGYEVYQFTSRVGRSSGKYLCLCVLIIMPHS